jgi:hypothetical protein
MMTSPLLGQLQVDGQVAAAIAEDYESMTDGLPPRLEDYVRERYRLDLSSEYGGLRIKNPFGKGSGQLSLNISQVRQDAQAGLGFVVLKTIIAEDSKGSQSMSEWAIPETRMAVERITGARGREGWTVTWKGRGWYESFDAYLKLYAEALTAGREVRMIVAPSCKYHLPGPDESEWKTGEYEYTTRRLLKTWESYGPGGAMPIEKDFSPTLAGSDRAAQVSTVFRWLRTVTGLIKRTSDSGTLTVGMKMFNAVFEEGFQLEMLRAIHEHCGAEEQPDFLVYANRLFDPSREFNGVRGVAYGGPDLSERNLNVLARLRTLEQLGEIPVCRIPISATGAIDSGQTAAEYLLRGASSFQLHTYFQLPNSEYHMKGGRKTERGLHELYFHPERGLIVWLVHLRRAFDWPVEWNVKKMADFCADPVNHLWVEHESSVR